MAVFCPSPDSFFVEEIPAYRPSGEGEHLYLWIEKKGLGTPEAVRRVARTLGVSERDVGYAGLKDRHATTRQYLSLPGKNPEEGLAAGCEGVVVLEAERHGNKLRLGHLRGNRFEVVLFEAGAGEKENLAARLSQLAREGLPNRFGHQRFGADADNVATALAILRGTRKERDRRKRQFFLSALQSAVFNRVLDLRQESGGLLRIRQGDILQKRQSGGLFASEDPALEAERVAAGEIVPTGPMPGNREREPAPGTEARALEDRALAELGVTREELATWGRFLPGARRPVTVPVELGDPPAADEAGSVRLRFSLGPGSYATVLLEALGVTTQRA